MVWDKETNLARGQQLQPQFLKENIPLTSPGAPYSGAERGAPSPHPQETEAADFLPRAVQHRRAAPASHWGRLILGKRAGVGRTLAVPLRPHRWGSRFPSARNPALPGFGAGAWCSFSADTLRRERPAAPTEGGACCRARWGGGGAAARAGVNHWVGATQSLSQVCTGEEGEKDAPTAPRSGRVRTPRLGEDGGGGREPSPPRASAPGGPRQPILRGHHRGQHLPP